MTTSWRLSLLPYKAVLDDFIVGTCSAVFWTRNFSCTRLMHLSVVENP